MKRLIRFAALACAVTCAACGGGAGGSVAPVATGTAAPATATPSPTPTPTPTPAPLQPSAATVTFNSNAPATLTVTQSGYTGSFTESDTCAPLTGTIATVHANATTGTASYAVTPIAAGTCQITVSNSAGQTVAVPVTVSTFALTVQ